MLLGLLNSHKGASGRQAKSIPQDKMSTSEEFDNLFAASKRFFHSPYTFKAPVLLTFARTFKSEMPPDSKLDISGKLVQTVTGLGGSYLAKFTQDKFYAQEKVKTTGDLWVGAGYYPEFLKGSSINGAICSTILSVNKELSVKYKKKPLFFSAVLSTDPALGLSFTHKLGSSFKYGLDCAFDLENKALLHYSAGCFCSNSGYNLTLISHSDELSAPTEFSVSLIKKFKEQEKLKIGGKVTKEKDNLIAELGFSKGFTEKHSKLTMKFDTEMNVKYTVSYRPTKAITLAVAYRVDLSEIWTTPAEISIKFSIN